MGKRAEQHEQRRLQLLQIALDQFITKGFYGTSTREISRIAGISSGLMFNYFSTKESLFEALVEIGCSKLVLEKQEEQEEQEQGSPLFILEKQITGLMSMIRDQPQAAKMFVFMAYASYNAAAISAKAGEMLAGHDLIKQCVPLIEEGQRLGEIRRGNPLALSIAFWCSVQGIAEEIALNPSRPLPEADWIVDILRAKEERE
ncbi:MAG: TetR family transcriptional regulator [Paenibacillaceae bacterium]|nr:TetR family transcriptional regulator [Paenibacillaceae bacterium]